MPAPHEILGVDEDADEAAIVAAYRERVKEVHPDQGGSTREFQAVHQAYQRMTEAGGAGSGADAPESDRGPAAADPRHRPGPGAGPGAVGERERGPELAATTVEYLDYGEIAARDWPLWDASTFERAAAADLDEDAHGHFRVRPGESLLEAAERADLVWPFACRGGACANCAVAVVEGELAQPVDHILPEHLERRGIRLSCNGYPLTDELRVVFGLQELPVLEDLRLPPGPFALAHPDGTAD